MKHIRSAAMAFVAGAALLASAAPSLAKADHARFSSAPIYTGAPALPTTLSMIVAGGGPSAFQSTKLVGVLAGDKTAAEVASLQAKFGADNVKSFLEVFDFVVNDSLAKVTAAKVPLPTQPDRPRPMAKRSPPPSTRSASTPTRRRSMWNTCSTVS
jgi:hypothetical protein